MYIFYAVIAVISIYQSSNTFFNMSTIVLRSVDPSIRQSADLSDLNSIRIIQTSFGRITDDPTDDPDDPLNK